MVNQNHFENRRQTLRTRSEDVVRWKRPGRIEDHKAWSIDRSDYGMGFCTTTETSPKVGEVINLRVFDRDRWMTVDRTVRVARADPAPGGELIFVGCAIEEPTPIFCTSDAQHAAAPVAGMKK